MCDGDKCPKVCHIECIEKSQRPGDDEAYFCETCQRKRDRFSRAQERQGDADELEQKHGGAEVTSPGQDFVVAE